MDELDDAKFTSLKRAINNLLWEYAPGGTDLRTLEDASIEILHIVLGPSKAQRTLNVENKIKRPNSVTILRTERGQDYRHGFACGAVAGLNAAIELTGVQLKWEEGRNDLTDPLGDTVIVRRAE